MQFVQVRSFDNYVQANIQLSMLQDAGINCHLKDENIITIDPLLNPLLGGMKLMVPEIQVTRALELLDAAEQNYLDDQVCPNCGHHELQAMIETDIPKGFWKKLLYTALYGQAEKIKNITGADFAKAFSTNCRYQRLLPLTTTDNQKSTVDIFLRHFFSRHPILSYLTTHFVTRI